ncbi:MAG: helix-turn-helix domain-containing protein [Streptococcaceae bacterium]|jgi:transcriptional regulator with XRE-family HTH domain|nr:helix-turn-helix domain-containing protein [Streptococcaceae bacterium]
MKESGALVNMNTFLGETFKKIRKSKNVEPKGISKSLISYSQLMRFESGESDISAVKFLRLLREINLTAEEFEVSFLKIQGDIEFSTISQVFFTRLNKESLKLTHLLSDTEKLIEQTPENQRLRLDHIQIESTLHRMGGGD